ncbi:MAG: ABC transporter permease [Cyclobacteriaceae bacterium]|jgi:putative ABC transport system permease protein
MFEHYLKISARSLLKFKGYTTINLIGLALALCVGLLIMIFVFDELAFDRFHVNGKRLYRIIAVFDNDQGGGQNETNAWPIGDIIRREFPEVESVLYTRSAGSQMVSFGGKQVREAAHFAGPEFFTMFSFPLTKGAAATALKDPYNVVISEKMEAKYFPGQSALGKTLTLNDTLEFQVTGVMKDIPAQSHIQADLIASFTTWERLNPDFSYQDGWGNFNMRNYVLLKPGTDPTTFFAKTADLYNQHAGDLMKQWGVNATVAYEPFEEVYLTSKAGNSMGPLGSLTTVYLLSGVGLFVIFLACINFVNLATARSVYRAKEVGIKKVVGSTRPRLVRQFLSESLVIVLVALVIALAALGLAMPLFNLLLGKSYTLMALLDWRIGAGIFTLLMFITLAAGFYPAWVMSAYKPAEILNGKIQGGKGGVQLRRVLVVAQFMISAGLVAGTLIVIHQLQFMQSRDLGFTRDEIFVLNITRTKAVDGNAYEGFLNELKSQTLVKDVTFCNALPAVSGWRGQWAYPEGKEDADHVVEMQYIAADERYVSTLGLKLLAGRNFDPARQSDEEALLINEEAVKQMGWGTPENAIGKKIVSPSQTPAGTVIGVLKNYHDWGLQNKIAPSAIDYNSSYAYLYAIRFAVADTKTLIESMGRIWRTYFPENEFNYFFLSEMFAKQYAKEERLAKVFSVFALLTIVIAVIGLFGLVSFMVTTKTKEIGVRKVLGASTWSLAALLSREFITLVLLANVVAIPVIIYFSQQWLQSYAYRMDLNPLIFMFTVIIALAVTVFTISIQTVQAAMSNPIKSLRTE